MRYDKLYFDHFAIYKVLRTVDMYFYRCLKYRCSGRVNPLSLWYFESQKTKLN